MKAILRVAAILWIAVLVVGCVTTEVARFQPKIGQEALVRDGRPGLISRKQNSIVMVSPARRQAQAGQRPIYVLAIFNAGRQPTTFLLTGVEVNQMRGGQLAQPLQVYSYDDLVTQERNRQVVGAILTVAAAGLNTYAASRSGYYNATGTVYGPGGVRTFNVSGYSPTANAIATARASAENEAMIANVVETGRRNMDALEENVIKDNTLMPGEWYGGQLHFDPPAHDSEKAFRIAVRVGGEVHEIDVKHEQVGR